MDGTTCPTPSKRSRQLDVARPQQQLWFPQGLQHNHWHLLLRLPLSEKLSLRLPLQWGHHHHGRPQDNPRKLAAQEGPLPHAKLP